MTNTTVPMSKLIGSLRGLAYGDAIGYVTEFTGYEALLDKHGEMGPEVPGMMVVSDDTQMSLAVWHAIDSYRGDVGMCGALRMELMVEFDTWARSPQNDRAPGNTCMASIDRLRKYGLGTWTLATDARSAGCGSVMRAPWIGVHPRVRDDQLDSVAALQAVLTHGPAENAFTAIAAARLTRALARGEVAPGDCANFITELAIELFSSKYDERALSDLWRHVYRTDIAQSETVKVGSTTRYVVEGSTHLGWVGRTAHQLSDELRANGLWTFDPCTVAGQGWRAREALALAVGILDGFFPEGVDLPGFGELLLRRAAMTNGDSDSIGAILGGLAGAAYGDIWSDYRLEPRYERELAAVIGAVPQV